MAGSRVNGEQVNRAIRMVVLGALLAMVATSLGGCFLFFPKRAAVVSGTLGPGRVDGQVVDERGRTIAGASATIPEAAQFTAVSGSDGRFSFPGLASGRYYVQVTKEGFLAGSFAVTVTSAQPVFLTAQLLDTSGHLHNDSRRVANLCADCHVLHNPTPASHLILGASPNSPCFASGCHAPVGTHGGFDPAVYENSPHGRNWSPNSLTKLVWDGQSATDRGNCATCHEPHGITGPPFMLRKGTQDADGTLHLNDLCLTCHSAAGTGNTTGWPGQTTYTATGNLHLQAVDVSLKYAAGDCGVCHVPHGQSFSGINYPAMTRLQGNQLCLKCHPGKATSQAGHGNCTMCHDPHNVQKVGGVLYVKDPANPTGPQIPVPKEGYRNETLIPGSYCAKCHKTPAPAGLPETPLDHLAATTRFWNQTVVSDRNLHNVHLNRVIASGTPNHYGYAGDNNKVRCGECHTAPHQTTVTHYLNPKYLTSVSGTYSGTWQSKNGCGVAAGCHTCSWCHYSPGNPGYSPACYECGWHGYSAHSGVVY